MAYPTVEQADAMLQLGSRFGSPEFATIERTTAAYGIIWCHWPSSEIIGYEIADRNRLIRPDGTIISWSPLPPKESV